MDDNLVLLKKINKQQKQHLSSSQVLWLPFALASCPPAPLLGLQDDLHHHGNPAGICLLRRFH